MSKSGAELGMNESHEAGVGYWLATSWSRYKRDRKWLEGYWLECVYHDDQCHGRSDRV